MLKKFLKESSVPTPPGELQKALSPKKFDTEVLKVGRLHENGTIFGQFMITQVLFIEITTPRDKFK